MLYHESTDITLKYIGVNLDYMAGTMKLNVKKMTGSNENRHENVNPENEITGTDMQKSTPKKSKLLANASGPARI